MNPHIPLELAAARQRELRRAGECCMVITRLNSASLLLEQLRELVTALSRRLP